jgi:hypothetical protein
MEKRIFAVSGALLLPIINVVDQKESRELRKIGD